MLTLIHFPFDFLRQSTRATMLDLFSIFRRFFSSLFYARACRNRMVPATHPSLGHARSLSQNGLASDHVQLPSQPLLIQHGRRYVFSQPILDHMSTCNASHLEMSRPGAQGRRVTHQQCTRQPGTVKHHRYHRAAAVYYTHSKVHFSIASKKNALRLHQPSRFASAVALSACCRQLPALRHSHSNSTSAPLLIFSLFLSPLGFQPFPPVPAILTFTESDLTNLSHQPGNPT